MDRRIKYTKMVLNESLLKFLEKKDISKITVTEICQSADVNRSTYYSHFTDPFDQIKKLKFDILKDLTDYTENIETKHVPAEERQYWFLKLLLEYVETRKHVFQILLTQSGNYNLQHEILTLLGEKALQYSSKQYINESERTYLLIYASNGCFGIFYRWLTEDDSINPDQLARLMADFTKNLQKFSGH